jgi:hypothetical protein
MASSAVASVVVGSWPIDISDGVMEVGRSMPSIRGGGGSGEKAFVRGVIEDKTNGFNKDIEAGFREVYGEVTEALCP